MLHRFREQFGAAGLVVAIVALIAALAGGAIAATGGGSGGKATASAKAKKGPRGPKGPAGPAGPQGPAGPAGPAGKDGANGVPGEDGEDGKSGTNGKNGTNGKSVAVTTENTGTGNCEGRGGSSFETEGSATKQYACNGKEGPQGAKGDPWTVGGTLPNGATETGAWAFGRVPENTEPGSEFPEFFAHIDYAYVPISFTIPLSHALAPTAVHYMKFGDPATAECPGNSVNPKALTGHLCVYVAEQSSPYKEKVGEPGVFEAGVFNFVGIEPAGEGGSDGASISGALLKYNKYNEGAYAIGTWAVTGAP